MKSSSFLHHAKRFCHQEWGVEEGQKDEQTRREFPANDAK
jgi:hypothetical protein